MKILSICIPGGQNRRRSLALPRSCEGHLRARVHRGDREHGRPESGQDIPSSGRYHTPGISR